MRLSNNATRLPSQTPRADQSAWSAGRELRSSAGTSTGSTVTPPHARSANFASWSRMSLCPRLINPPLGQSRACWRVKDAPQPSQWDGKWLGSWPYRMASWSLNWLMTISDGQLVPELGWGQVIALLSQRKHCQPSRCVAFHNPPKGPLSQRGKTGDKLGAVACEQFISLFCCSSHSTLAVGHVICHIDVSTREDCVLQKASCLLRYSERLRSSFDWVSEGQTTKPCWQLKKVVFLFQDLPTNHRGCEDMADGIAQPLELHVTTIYNTLEVCPFAGDRTGKGRIGRLRVGSCSFGKSFETLDPHVNLAGHVLADTICSTNTTSQKATGEHNLDLQISKQRLGLLQVSLLNNKNALCRLCKVTIWWTDLKQASEPRFDLHEPASTRRIVCIPVLFVLSWIFQARDQWAHSDSIHQHGQGTSLCCAFTTQNGVQLTSWQAPY